MNTVHVVNQCWQEYGGGGGSTTIFVTSSIEKAEAKVAEMKAQQKVRNSVYSLIQEFMKAWEAINPRPSPVIDKQKKTKKNPLPLDDQFRQWAADRYKKQIEFTATFTQDEQDYLRELNDELFWEIETVPYEE